MKKIYIIILIGLFIGGSAFAKQPLIQHEQLQGTITNLEIELERLSNKSVKTTKEEKKILFIKNKISELKEKLKKLEDEQDQDTTQNFTNAQCNVSSCNKNQPTSNNIKTANPFDKNNASTNTNNNINLKTVTELPRNIQQKIDSLKNEKAKLNDRIQYETNNERIEEINKEIATLKETANSNVTFNDTNINNPFEKTINTDNPFEDKTAKINKNKDNSVDMVDVLTGDEKTSCEVILCLSTSQRPQECAKPIAKFFAIKAYRKGRFSLDRTIKKRRDFLAICPTQQDKVDPIMKSLQQDILPHQETMCNANELNKMTDRKQNRIRTKHNLPSYCQALRQHKYTDVKLPTNTCTAKYYDRKDWGVGYETVYIGTGINNRKIYNDWLNNGNKGETRLVDTSNNNSQIQYYKHIPIIKKCWID